MCDLDDDMQELLRRAAKDYPLRAAGSQWETVRRALEEAALTGHATAEKSSPKERGKRWPLILLHWKALFQPAAAQSARKDQQDEATR